MEATPEPEPELEQFMGPNLPTTIDTDALRDSIQSQPSFRTASGLDALSTAATIDIEYMRQLSMPIQTPRPINTPQHSVNNLDFILNPAGSEGRLSEKMILSYIH